MPIVTEHSEPKKRRALWWVLLVLLVGLPGGMVAWSFYSRVELAIGPWDLVFGREPNFKMRVDLMKHLGGGTWAGGFQMPGDVGNYMVLWSPRRPRSN